MVLGRLPMLPGSSTCATGSSDKTAPTSGVGSAEDEEVVAMRALAAAEQESQRLHSLPAGRVTNSNISQLAPAASAAAPIILQAAAAGQEFLLNGVPSYSGNNNVCASGSVGSAQAQRMLAGIGCNFVSEQRCAYGLTNVLRPTVPFLVGSYASRLTSGPQQQKLLLKNGQLSLRQKASNVKGKVISQAELQKRLPSWFIVEDAMDRMLLDMANQDFITADNIADVQIFRTQQRDLAKQFLDRGAWARFLELQQDMMLCMWEKSRSFGHDHGLIDYLLVQVALADVSKTFKSSTVDATAVSPGASGDVAKPLGKRAKHFDKNGKECCWLNMHGGCKYGSGCRYSHDPPFRQAA
eukprot:jgi/Chrzof1/5301/Cz15g21120.t1